MSDESDDDRPPAFLRPDLDERFELVFRVLGSTKVAMDDSESDADIQRIKAQIDQYLKLREIIRKASGEWKSEADDIINELKHPTYLGEWSLGLDLQVVSLWAQGPFNHALETMDDFQMNVAYRGYAAAQLATFEKYLGWFFWSYKTETTPAWCFRDCVNNGWTSIFVFRCLVRVLYK
jgi:hypothetical protein